MGYYEDAVALAEELGMPVAPRDAPSKFVARTPERLAEVVADRMRLLEVDAAELSRRAGVPQDAVEAIARDGRADLEDIYHTLDALNLKASCLPRPWGPR